MKKYFLLLISLSIGVAYSQKNKTITGNEKITTITRTTSAYEGIEISGSFDVKLISGQEGNLTIKGDENVLEYIITEVKNGRLAVYFDKNKSIRYNYNSSIEITIPVEEIKQLVTFYKQKATDTEFNLLQTQLKLNRFLLTEPAPEKNNISKKNN